MKVVQYARQPVYLLSNLINPSITTRCYSSNSDNVRQVPSSDTFHYMLLLLG
jgi:hypothetical protein